MKRFVKLAICFALAVTMCLPLAACKGEDVKTAADYGFGDGKDGTKITGTFNWSDEKIESTDKETEARAYTAEKAEDLKFEVKIKIGEATSGDKAEKAKVGGYAYFSSKDNYVSFLFNKEAKELAVQTKKGYDEQTQIVNIPSSVDFNNYISFKTEKLGNEFRFFVEDKQVTCITEIYSGEGQAAIVTDYHSASFKDVIVTKNINAFSTATVLTEVITPAAGGAGEWVSSATNKIARTDAANQESVAFNYNFLTDYSFTSKAKQTNEANDELYGFYGVIGYYQNDNNYVIVFFKGEWIDIVYKNAGDYQWTGGVKIPNYDALTANEVRFEKIGTNMKIFVNNAFIREISSKTFNRPGMTGYDTNGASAEFENVEIKNISSFTANEDRVDFNFPHLVSVSEETKAITTINEGCVGGENYGGIVTGYASIYGLDYTYEVKMKTAFLSANGGNYIGLMGGYCNDGVNETYFTVFLNANKTVDLFGVFTAGEIEATGGFANASKAVPESCLTDGNLSAEITFKVVKDEDNFKIFMNDEEVYSIKIAKLKYSKPGFMANYVGAEFSVL